MRLPSDLWFCFARWYLLYSQIISVATFYMCCLKTYILGTESLDFIVSIWHQVSQGDSKVTNGHSVVYVVRPILLTLALIRNIQ